MADGGMVNATEQLPGSEAPPVAPQGTAPNSTPAAGSDAARPESTGAAMPAALNDASKQPDRPDPALATAAGVSNAEGATPSSAVGQKSRERQSKTSRSSRDRDGKDKRDSKDRDSSRRDSTRSSKDSKRSKTDRVKDGDKGSKRSR